MVLQEMEKKHRMIKRMLFFFFFFALCSLTLVVNVPCTRRAEMLEKCQGHFIVNNEEKTELE